MTPIHAVACSSPDGRSTHDDANNNRSSASRNIFTAGIDHAYIRDEAWKG